MRLRHELIIARKYEKPEVIRGIYTNPAWRQDNSRALWEVVQSSPEADAMLQTELQPDWILVTPPRSGVFLRYAEGHEHYLLHAALVLRVIPWTLGGTMPKTLGNRLLVRPDEPAEKHAGIIAIPETARRRPTTGRIVDVGTEVKDEHLKVGARILYSMYSGTDLDVSGEALVILGAEQAQLVLADDEEVKVA